MSESDSESVECRRKNGKINKHLHVREMEKLARRRGEEFVSNGGFLVKSKVTGPGCDCRMVCMTHFSNDQRKSIIKNLYTGRHKNERDTFHMGLIDRFDVARHRPKNEHSKQTSSSFKYFSMRDNERFPVWRKAYISLHGISNKVVTRLTHLKESNKTPEDKRGQHSNRPNAISLDNLTKIHDHVSSFPTKVTHYTSVPVHYLDSDLSITKIYTLFLEKYPELKRIIEYEYYLKYFKDNFSYPFGRPQVDVCSTCEDLNTKIKSTTLIDTAKRVAVAEMLVHKRRAKTFYHKIQEGTELCKNREDTTAIVSDYMQNLPLPFMPVQEMFYLRKLWYYVFNISDLNNTRSVVYTYSEGTAKKGPDEVCSFINHYIEHYIPLTVNHIHIFSVACGGQNRNHTLNRLLLALTMTGRFETINQYYPVRGHSFMLCDRTFGVLKRAIKKHDRIYSPNQYKVIICNAKKKIPTYEVVDVQTGDVLNFKAWGPQFFKNTFQSTGNVKEPFAISKYRHIIYDAKLRGYIKTNEFIDGAVYTSFKLNKGDNVTFPSDKAYNGKVPIKKKKLDDVGSVLNYIPDEYRPFYVDRLSWPTCDAADTEDMDD